MTIRLKVHYSDARSFELLDGVSKYAKDWGMGSDKAATIIS
jgi:hypothetical protein